MKKIIFLLLILFTITGCKDSIEGTWERQGDDLQGMRVKVYKNENSMYGEITQKAFKENNFSINETKWKNLKKVGTNEYECEDLRKNYSDYSFAQAHLKIDGDLLTIDMFVNDGTAGNHQIYMRVKQ